MAYILQDATYVHLVRRSPVSPMSRRVRRQCSEDTCKTYGACDGRLPPSVSFVALYNVRYRTDRFADVFTVAGIGLRFSLTPVR